MRETEIKPFIIAHRGASAVAPENTLAAFQKAIEIGAEGIEFDVRLAKDGVPIVFHDSKLQRTARKNGYAADFTSEELQAFDVGSWFNFKNPKKANDEFSEQTVPTLAQLLEFLSDYDGLVYIELKHNSAETLALVESVSRIIERTHFLRNIIVKSFDLDSIYQMRQMLPKVRTAALFAPKILTLLHKESRRILEEAQKCEADEISIHYSLATQNFVETARENGFPTTIWTVDNPVWIKRAVNSGINAIITNNPAKLLALKQKYLLSDTGISRKV